MASVVGRITELARTGLDAAKDIAETSFDKASDLGQAALPKARERLDSQEAEVISLTPVLNDIPPSLTVDSLKMELADLVCRYNAAGIRDRVIKVELEAAASDL